MELFEALAARRKELGMQYEELSEKSKIPANTLKKIFTGKIGSPSFESIKAIAYAMDMTLEELDRIIEGKNEYNATDMEMAKAISTLDAPGKEAVRAALESQQQRIKEYGPATRKTALKTRRVPVIQGTNEAELQMLYQAKMERSELAELDELSQLISADGGIVTDDGSISIDVLQ